ncbi:MAG: LytR C-terminal domain-containing protein [Gemmatimonadetes bacterium]|nr:LytR C-terminal domain-containing protein [Gemmatimonadota bacterium]
MSARSRLEAAALAVALLATVAFVVSAVLGIAAGDDAAATPPATDVPAPADTAGAPLPPSGPESTIRVEVLNGSGLPGRARDATEQLRSRGYDVVYFGNASDGPWAASRVIDRVGHRERAEGVARALGIRQVETRVDSTLLLDATVVIGKDWRPPAPQARPPSRRSFWDKLFGGEDP